MKFFPIQNTRKAKYSVSSLVITANNVFTACQQVYENGFATKLGGMKSELP
jgi:hypothetical protein